MTITDSEDGPARQHVRGDGGRVLRDLADAFGV